jgi:hypothetical protein
MKSALLGAIGAIILSCTSQVPENLESVELYVRNDGLLKGDIGVELLRTETESVCRVTNEEQTLFEEDAHKPIKDFPISEEEFRGVAELVLSLDYRGIMGTSAGSFHRFSTERFDFRNALQIEAFSSDSNMRFMILDYTVLKADQKAIVENLLKQIDGLLRAHLK